MEFVQSVRNLPAPFFLWEMIGFVVTVYLETMILVAVFLSSASKTQLMLKDQPHMCETSRIVAGTRRRKGSFTIRKSLGKRTFSRNNRRLYGS